MSDKAFIDIVAPDGGTKIAAERYLIGKPSAAEVSRSQMNWLSEPFDQVLAIRRLQSSAPVRPDTWR